MNDPAQSNKPAEPAAPSPSPPAASDAELARQSWRSEELLGERTEVLILHGTDVYRLRRTRQGKLILYK
jgi:hemin uptake protein HemP